MSFPDIDDELGDPFGDDEPDEPPEDAYGDPASEPDSGDSPPRARYTFQPGGSFILDQSRRPTAVWGAGDDVLSAEGEATLLAGVQGTGKTTLAQQFALGRCGFDEYAELLGYPIRPGMYRVLYLAMDRPRQIARSLRRMVGEAWRAELDDRLVVWTGPPPFDLAKHPPVLRQMARDAGADTVIVDSLKDAAIGLSDDEVGAGWNRARQYVMEAGIEMLELHHGRKALNGAKRDKLTLDDVYGSTWITSGCGSVLLLSGEPGDVIVRLHHVKQPMSEVGPLDLLHDHDAGRTTVRNSTDLLAIVYAHGSITAATAAKAIFGVEEPTPSQVEKARRRLDKLADGGQLVILDEGGRGRSGPRTWGPK